MSEERVSLAQNQPPAPIVQPGELGYVPPVDSVPLPSKGKIYPVDSALFNAESVEIRSMTARDEDILSSAALLKSGKALGSLIQACVLNKAIDTDQMISGDRNALLIAIRITGYGNEYDVEIKCQNEECGREYKHTFALQKLEIKPLGAEPTGPGRNEFSFDLPVLKKRCLFRLLTGADERDMSAQTEKMKKVLGPGAAETGVTMRLFYQITQIGEEKDRNKLQKIIQTMPAMDSRKLRQYIDKVSPGVKMEQETTCPHCQDTREVPVPFGTEFFWPSS